MFNRVGPAGLLDWGRLAVAERWGGLYEMVRRPEAREPAYYPLYRQFVCACCRRLLIGAGPADIDRESRDALDVIEAFAHGRTTFDELVRARDRARSAARRVRRRQGFGGPYAIALAIMDAGRNDALEAIKTSCGHAAGGALGVREQAELFQAMAEAWAAERGGTR